jgi:hypothetical protein
MKSYSFLIVLFLCSCAVRQKPISVTFKNPECLKIFEAFKDELVEDDIRIDTLSVLKKNNEYRTIFTPNPGIFSKNKKYRGSITFLLYNNDTTCYLYKGDNGNHFFMIGKPKRDERHFDAKLFYLKIYKVDSSFIYKKEQVKSFELVEPIKNTIPDKIYQNENDSELEWELNGFFQSVVYIYNGTVDLFHDKNETEIIRRFSRTKPSKSVSAPIED